MNQSIFGIKEIYDCVLKPTLTIEFGGKTYQPHEPIIIFDKLQIADFKEVQSHAFARGGYHNQVRVTWDTTEELSLTFSQGLFSKTSLALLGNSNLRHDETVEVFEIEYLTVDENKQVELKNTPKTTPYIYTSTAASPSYSINNKIITFTNLEEGDRVSVYYTFDYVNADIITIGQKGLHGFLELSAKTRLKDDITGQIVTGIFEIPKLKLMSDFSIRLGSDAPPAVGRFTITAYPTGVRGKERVADLIILKDNLDSDL